MNVKMGVFDKQFEPIQLQFAGIHTRLDDLLSHRHRGSTAALLIFVAVVVAVFGRGARSFPSRATVETFLDR